MHRAHQIRLYPTPEQDTLLRKACGVARFAYNWGLAEWKNQYEAWKVNPLLPKPNAFALRRQLNACKRAEFPWMLEVTKCAPMEALLRLGDAYRNFFRGTHNAPVFKKRGKRDSFTVSIEGGTFRFDNRCLWLTKIPGMLSLAEPFRFPSSKLLSVTVKRIANRWYAVVNCDIQDQPNLHLVGESQADRSVGIDLGLEHFATLSTGEQVEHPRYLRNSLTKLARLQKKMERKVKGSKNRWKAKMQVALKHAEVANQRKGFLHRLTSDLASRFDRIVVEDLCVAGMVQTRLAKSISDSGWGEFRKMLSYKAKELVVADRWFPSSKLCSCCNFKLETLPLSCRSWTCPECETVHDRDRNAAVNLERYNTPLSGLSWPRLSAEASCA